MARNDPTILVRVSPDVKGWIEEEARKNMRSQSAEVAYVLMEKMRTEKDQPQK